MLSERSLGDLSTFGEVHLLATELIVSVKRVVSNDFEGAAAAEHDIIQVIMVERLFAYHPETSRKHNAFQSAFAKAPFTDVLDAVRNFDAFEIAAVLERPRLEHPHTAREDERLETVIEEAARTDSLEPVRKLNTLQASAASERVVFNAFEPHWEADFRKSVTPAKCPFLDGLQLTSLFKRNFLQVPAALKCAFLNRFDVFRNDYLFYPNIAETILSDFLELAAFLDQDALQLPAFAKRFYLYHFDTSGDSDALDVAVTKPVASDFLNALRDNDFLELSQVPEKFVADHRVCR